MIYMKAARARHGRNAKIQNESLKGSKAAGRREIFTIGHSTRSLPEFISILKNFRISVLADVRTIPRSRHNPQFNSVQLSAALKKSGIRYLHMPGLGGLRRAKPDSINAAWRNASFRGYADYMQTREFVHNLQPLIRIAKQRRTTIMCAEALPWRCHRSLIADALTTRHFAVLDIMGEDNARPHVLTPWAQTEGVKVWYPPPGE